MSGADRLLVLTWHAVDERASVISTPPGRFRRQLDQLAEHGCRGMGLAEAFRQRAAAGRFPREAVVLTFDDGYRSVVEHALPALGAHGFTGTVFLASGLVGLSADRARARNPALDRELLDRDLLDWDEAAALRQAGWEIGSHSVSHPDLTRLDAAAQARELGDSKAQLEQGLNISVRSFAYPYGRLNRSVRDAAAHHYDFACTTRLAHHPGDGDPLRVDRIDMYYMQDPDRFARLLAGGLDVWLPLRRALRAVRRLAH
ncbi:MAG: polysaccharide deacetylase family protein [Xanthomonadales bacterium]|nr:polysaccharide deacetylase family protein [Xanthomonadales bacterium]